MRNRGISGFTLFEFFMTLIIIAVVSGVVVPIVMYGLKLFRLNAFKNDAYNALDAAKIYIATSNFSSIPEEGVEISKLNLELKNNNFDGGVIKKISNDKYEIVNLKKDNYCARGTTDNMKVSDKGCGALDITEPVSATVFIKEYNGQDITVIAGATDNESKIVGYEFNIDGSKFTKKSSSNEYTFKGIKGSVHTFRVRVTNEAGKTSISDNIKLNVDIYSHITCYERNSKELYQISKNVVCKYPTGKDYLYQYSSDNINWYNLKLVDNLYKFKLDDNKEMYTRVLDKKRVVAYNIIKTSNIDKTLNGAYPNLLDNMIPVIYDYNKKAWIKADSRLKYFDYDNKQWANAVYVRRVKDIDDPLSKNRDYYLSDSAIGQVIYDKDILAYYVWIPRFKYRLFNTSDVVKNPISIDVVFDNNNNEVLYNNKVDTYITSRAFLYDNTNGFWVSKYQSSAADTASCYNDLSTCDKSDLLIYSKDDKKKITNISLANAHLSTSSMNKKGNIYGMEDEAKPHILTNLEYGSILYLTNSIYGIGINNYELSSTGNMSGVFDLNTDYPEMVMGNYNNDAGLNESDNSGFKDYGIVDWPSYIDIYKGITSKNRILGDATGETNGWFNSYSKFVNGENPFFIRGGLIEGKRSIYNYSSFTGAKNPNYTFRTSLIK